MTSLKTLPLTERDLETKQDAAADFIYSQDASILVAPTGAGKTVICLTAIKELIQDKHIKRVIVACPAKVVQVWPREARKWEHLRGLHVHDLQGTPDQRKDQLRAVNAHVFVVSLNNLDWLLDQKHDCDGVIVDELSKAAGKQARGLKTKRRGDCFKWRVGMTATPVSQDFQKLYGMCRILDDGKALGRNKDTYLNTYFFSDYMGYNWTLRPGAAELIMSKIRPLVHIVEDTKEADLPPLTEHISEFAMGHAAREKYDEMKKELVADDVEAANEAVKSGKLRQIASGFLYREDESGLPINANRATAAMKWFWGLNGRRGVIFYEYVEQGAQLARVMQSHEITTELGLFLGPRGPQILLAQINSLSHGVDGLQHVCHDALMYQPFWSRDATEQAIGRIWRKGQTDPVDVTTLVCDNSLDQLVMARVEDRGEWMKLFKKHLEDTT